MPLDEKNLGLRFLRAESAAEVRDIVNGDNALSAPGNWHPLGGLETNANMVTNQATNGGKAT